MSEERFDRIETKVDVIVDKISNIEVTLAKQHESLAHHIKRTDLLEQQVEPIRVHVAKITGARELLKILSMIVALVGGILAVIHYFK
jgi:hypothetical protein